MAPIFIWLNRRLMLSLLFHRHIILTLSAFPCRPSWPYPLVAFAACYHIISTDRMTLLPTCRHAMRHNIADLLVNNEQLLISLAF